MAAPVHCHCGRFLSYVGMYALTQAIDLKVGKRGLTRRSTVGSSSLKVSLTCHAASSWPGACDQPVLLPTYELLCSPHVCASALLIRLKEYLVYLPYVSQCYAGYRLGWRIPNS
jgi:hypothetical protein